MPELLRSELQLQTLPEPLHRRALLQEIVLPGGAAGTLGAVSVAAVLSVFTGVLHHAWMRPLQLVGAMFWREAWPEQLGAGAAWMGALVLLAGGSGLGVGYAALLPRGGTRVAAIGLSMLYGVALMAGVELVVPWLNPVLARATAPLVYFPAMLLFAAPLPVVTSVRRALQAYVSLRHRVARFME